MKNQIKIESVADIKELSTVNENGCWVWQGTIRYNREGKDPRGYVGHVYVYRMAWELKNKAVISKGLVARHSCDNSLCVNPDHIEIGTQKDNGRDASVRNRVAHKLSPEQVAAILSSAEKLGPAASAKQIADDVNDPMVTHHNVYDTVVRGINRLRAAKKPEPQVAPASELVMTEQRCERDDDSPYWQPKPVVVEVIRVRAA